MEHKLTRAGSVQRRKGGDATIAQAMESARLADGRRHYSAPATAAGDLRRFRWAMHRGSFLRGAPVAVVSRGCGQAPPAPAYVLHTLLAG